ncbi:MAG: TIM barrel protein [Candidatus Moduliflexus flocculans]|nr:TIM barrel protein [Candidatus Moduliflexus flocculans]
MHNHGPGDRRYPTPRSVLDRVGSLDPRIGVCLDVGHCERSGLDPSAEAAACGPRLLDVHLKDVTAASEAGVAVEIGRGVVDIPRLLRTLRGDGLPRHGRLRVRKRRPGSPAGTGRVRRLRPGSPRGFGPGPEDLDERRSGMSTRERLASLDAFRGFDILAMVFVNYIAGMKAIPFFLRHAAAGQDVFTLTDVVFPGFLFIMGVSIPLALAKGGPGAKNARPRRTRPRPHTGPPLPRRPARQRGPLLGRGRGDRQGPLVLPGHPGRIRPVGRRPERRVPGRNAF